MQSEGPTKWIKLDWLKATVWRSAEAPKAEEKCKRRNAVFPTDNANTAAEAACYLAAPRHELTYLSVDPLQFSNEDTIREGVKISLLLNSHMRRHAPPCSTTELTLAGGFTLRLTATDQMPE